MNKIIGITSTVPYGKFPAIKPNSTLGKIIQSLYDTYDPFIKTLKCHKNPNLSSEKSLVQEFIIQNDIQLRKHINSLRIEKEYTDNFYKTKGIPDFAYLPLEEGVSHEPIFIVEAKILPAPDHFTLREKEYVIGNNNNGGIERFKTGKHGIGINYCGIVGFICDNNTINTWINRINSWIMELSKEKNSIWSCDEILEIIDNSKQIQSIAKRPLSDVYLYHFFIKL
ncbi:hypothetical protein [Odoribacter lunatus]|uniref:hypothetical protein n=1 Tax=Odoribacter lunatus TaxID=2941335 RepID=UPI00203C826D|nr:hypothetical protein [Odoribacter lunatus]